MTPEPDVESFQRLYSAYVDPVLGYALRRVGTPADAADVVAETSSSRGAGARRCRPARPRGCGCTAWPAGCSPTSAAVSCAAPRWGAGCGPSCPPSYRTRPAAVAERTDAARALARLGAADREVVELTAWEGLDSREVAEVLGITPMAARARLSRARRGCARCSVTTPSRPDTRRPGPPRPSSGGTMTTQLTPTITDDEVAELPLGEARADLLRELLAETGAGSAPVRRRRRWPAALAAAAALVPRSPYPSG